MDILDAKNKKAWSNEIKKNIMLYPNERVVAFLGRNYKFIDENIDKCALDIGFGSGRHLKLLLDYNFSTYGTDYSKECLEIAQKELGENEQLKGLFNESFEKLSFPSEFFDVVLFWGVSFLRPFEEMKKDLEYIYKLTKFGGKLLIDFRTTEDGMYGSGEKISEGTFILNNKFPAYEGMVYTFLDLEKAKYLVESVGFNIINIEREDYWKDNLQQKNSWWIITLEK